jgi:hypothetical protein
MTDITALTNALNFLTEQEDYVKVRDQVRVMADMPTDPNDRDIAFDRYWREIDSLLDRAVDGDRLAAKKVLGDYVLPIPPIH